MADSLRHVASDSVLTGWDFSTSGVKCLAFDLDGNTLAEVRLPTDLWTAGGVSEFSITQLEGQARGTVRAMAEKLRALDRVDKWVAGGISATHHTAGRIDKHRCQVRRAICWNDQTLHAYHEIGLKRLGGQKNVRERIGGPWAIRYSLSHLVKDEATLADAGWQRTDLIGQHGVLAAGYLTGNFAVISVSGAASTGIMDLRTNQWSRPMLDALADEGKRELAWNQLPRIVDQNEPLGPISDSLAAEASLMHRPLVFPTSDDQQAGLIGGGAVDAGQMAIIVGTSAVVNSSGETAPKSDKLDAMRLNWGPYLWMRCYNNGAQIVNHVVGPDPDWAALEEMARKVPPGCDGTTVSPFLYPEPSLGVTKKAFGWSPKLPADRGMRFRAALEALAYLIALGVRQHEKDGQTISRITVSGGIARSRLMCEIVASVLGKPLELLVSDEGPALGAAVTCLAALENHRRHAAGDRNAYPIAAAVQRMVRFREPVLPVPEWRAAYSRGAKEFERKLGTLRKDV